MRDGLLNASDSELLVLSRVDPDAFAVFYRRHERLAAGWLMRQTRRPEAAADLTAEVFAAAYLAAAQFDPRVGSAGAWLLGIARNKLLHSWRAERLESSARARLAVAQIQFSQESLARVEELGSGGVLELLDSLPVDQRDAVRARAIEELDYEEFSRHAGISPDTARKRVSRGLAGLRRRIRAEGGRR